MRRFTSCLVCVAALTALIVPAALSAAPGRAGVSGIGRVSPGALRVGRPQRGLLLSGIRYPDRRYDRRFARFDRGFGRFGRRNDFDGRYAGYGFGGYGFATGYGEADAGARYPGLPGIPVVLGIPAAPVAKPTIFVVKGGEGGRSSLRGPSKASEGVAGMSSHSGTLGARIVQVEVPRG